MQRNVTLVSRFFSTCFLLIIVTLLNTPSVRGQTASNAPPPHAASASPSDKATEHIPADLSKDARLDRRLTLHEVGTPFNALLKKISNSELALTVETDSAERKLHINLKERSIRQLMQSLADLFPGDWYAAQEGKGYRFEMNLKAARRRQRWWGLFLGEREKALDAMRAAVLHAMRTPPQPPAKLVTDHAHEDGIDAETWREIARQKTVFNTLPAALQEQIANQINDTPWYNQRDLFTSSGMQDGALLIPVSAFPDEIRSRFVSIPQDPRGNAPLEGDVYVRFSNFGISVTASLVTLDGKILRTVGKLSVLPTPDMMPLRLNRADLPQEVKKRGKAASPAWKELAAFQQSRVWPNDPPKPAAKRQRPNRIEMQEALAQNEGLEFVSDFYSTLGDIFTVPTEKLARPLKEELDWQAQAQDISWKQEAQSGLYLFRSNRWYRDDLLEIPAPILQRWKDYKKRQITLELQRQKQGIKVTREMAQGDFLAELDSITDFVCACTPWQLFNGMENVMMSSDELPLSIIEQATEKYRAEKGLRPDLRRPFDQDILGIQILYHTLLFYGGLSQDERAALFAGRIDANALTPAQQQQARYILPALQVISPPPEGEPLLIGIEIMPGGGWIGLPYLHLVLAARK